MSEDDNYKIPEAMPIQTENIAFDADELVACAKCQRNNPPTRLNCFYCGSELEIAPENRDRIRPSLRKLEAWEKGFNLIVEPVAAPDIVAVARLVKLEPDLVRNLFESGKRLPIARVESAAECEVLQTALAGLGVPSNPVSDEALAVDVAPRRLRGIEFGDSGARFILFNDDSIVDVSPEDLKIIVTGAVFEKAVEATEKRKKGQTRMLDATETASDEPLLDLYSGNDASGFRITTAGFDFSCLGSEKGLLARENLKRLAKRLAVFAPEARVVDDYLSVRELLGEVWETDVRKDSQGMKRSSFGKFDLKRVSTSSNLRQFTKYSRLQRHIL